MKDAKRRLQCTREWRRFDEWEKALFSDEYSVQRKPNNLTQFIFRFSDEAYQNDLVNLINYEKGISQMIWGPISLGGRSEVVIMEPDESSPRRGYSTKSYLQGLE